jgi:hypothetical protein
MERGRGPGGLELREQSDRVAGGQRVDLDPAVPKRVERRRVGLEPSVGARADHEAGRQLVQYLLEVVEDEPVPLSTPPAGDDAAGEDDHILTVLVPVDEHPAELVSLDPGHRPRVARAALPHAKSACNTVLLTRRAACLRPLSSL